MRSRRTAQDPVAEVARRRLELLSAELAAIRPDPVHPPSRLGGGGSGELRAITEEDAARPAAVGRGVPLRAPADATEWPRPGRHALRPERSRAVLGGWLEDRLPPSMQGRVRMGAPHLTVVALLVAAAMGLLAWTSVRAADPGAVVSAREPSGAVSSPSGLLVTPVGAPAVPVSQPAAGAAGTDGAEVVVDVTGKVRRPGIVRLPAGSRVVDAIEAAGGVRRGVDDVGVNLARVLVDGEQVVVGVPAPAGVAAPASSGLPDGGRGVLVNINTATQTELEALPGVGPVTAQAILQWRTDNGAFSAVDELMEVSGIGEATLAELAPFVTI